MKKSLLAFFTMASIAAFAQPDVEAVLTSPANNGTITAGVQFSFDVTINNVGTEPIDLSDSIIVAPTVGGNYINSGGNPLIWLTQQAIPVGGSYTFSNPLNLSGGTAGNLNFCAVVAVTGAGWTGVTEANTANNESCNTVTYDNGMAVSELSVAVAGDKSFFANGVYHVRMENQTFKSTPSLVVFDITGAQVMSSSLVAQGGEVNQEVNLSQLPKGIYLVKVLGGVDLAAKKIAID